MKTLLLFLLTSISTLAADITLLGFDEKGVLTSFILRGDGFTVSPPGANPRVRIITIAKPITAQTPIQFPKVETFDVSEQHNIFILTNNPVGGKTTLTYTSPATGISTPLAISLYVGKYVSTFIPDSLGFPGKVTVNYLTEDIQ